MPETLAAYRFAEQLHHPELSVETRVRHNRPAATITLTTTFTLHSHNGRHVGVIALIYDDRQLPQWLYTSEPVLYTLQASLTGESDLTGRITLPLEAEIAIAGRHLVIKHYHCRNDAWTDIKEWIRIAEHPDSGYPTVSCYSQRVAF